MASHIKMLSVVAVQNFSMLLIVLLQLFTTGLASWDDYIMAEDLINDCGKLITGKGGRIKAYEDQSTDTFNCRLTINAADSNKMLFLYFEKFILKAGDANCNDHKLEIFDGSALNASSLTGEYGLCQKGDDTELPQPIRTTANSVTLHMTRNGASSSAQFRIIFSTFKKSEGGCYKCQDTTDLCIDTSLACDGLDNCPMGSDEDRGDGGGCKDVGFVKIWIIVVAIVVGVIVLVLLIVCICFIWVVCRRRTRPKATATTGYQTQGTPMQHSGQGAENPPPQGNYPPPEEHDAIIPQKSQ
ncbi:uncharacterized protein LOC144438957 [Glandiceps talaboti]